MKIDDLDELDPERLRSLFDLGGKNYESRGGGFDVDIYPMFHELRRTGPVHEGIPGPMLGFHGEVVFEGLPYPDRPHFSAFDWATCDSVFRDPETFCSTPPDQDGSWENAILIYLDGERHRRYRSLVQPSFVPKAMRWWLEHWITSTVNTLIDRIEDRGRADLNLEFCALIPLLTICGSFGVTATEALDIRAAVTSDGVGLDRFVQIVAPLIAERRERPRDDLVSVLTQAEVTDDDGARHVLTDSEVLSFAYFLLAAGSGTTWKQMGITLLALLTNPDWLAQLRANRSLMRNVIEESLRWTPTDPVFARFVTRDISLHGCEIPAGSVLHIALAAANRDPERWDRPDQFDPGRRLAGHLSFGTGPHVCLGMHVARTELECAISALLDRLPNLRLDTLAPPPRIIGMYERGPTSVPVIWNT